MAKLKPMDNPEYAKILCAIAQSDLPISVKQLRLLFKSTSCGETTPENFSMKIQNLNRFLQNTRTWEHRSSTSKYEVKYEGLLQYVLDDVLELRKRVEESVPILKKLGFPQRHKGFHEFLYINPEIISWLRDYIIEAAKKINEEPVSIRSLLVSFVEGVGIGWINKRLAVPSKSSAEVDKDSSALLLFQSRCYFYLLRSHENTFSILASVY